MGTLASPTSTSFSAASRMVLSLSGDSPCGRARRRSGWRVPLRTAVACGASGRTAVGTVQPRCGAHLPVVIAWRQGNGARRALVGGLQCPRRGPNFWKMERTWVSTVLADIMSRSAMTGLESPLAMQARTSRSRSVSRDRTSSIRRRPNAFSPRRRLGTCRCCRSDGAGESAGDSGAAGLVGGSLPFQTCPELALGAYADGGGVKSSGQMVVSS